MLGFSLYSVSAGASATTANVDTTHPKNATQQHSEQANATLASPLCRTATHTLAYRQTQHDDPLAQQAGHWLISNSAKLNATLRFVCLNQAKMQDPQFVKEHFDFIAWQPKSGQWQHDKPGKPLLENKPPSAIVMTKYYVHLAQGANQASELYPVPLLGLPYDEQHLTLAQADSQGDLTRHRFGKQQLLAMDTQTLAPALAYLRRVDFEAALLQGSIVLEGLAKTDAAPPLTRVFNVHRSNGIAYDKRVKPEQQQRYWYFKEVDGIKGYGLDADHKITVDIGVTFAGDLEAFGLGRLLWVESTQPSFSKLGIIADTGGAFVGNDYQIDYLSGQYPSRQAWYDANKHLPDYVNAYFLVVKDRFIDQSL